MLLLRSSLILENKELRCFVCELGYKLDRQYQVTRAQLGLSSLELGNVDDWICNG